jgi:thermitase
MVTFGKKLFRNSRAWLGLGIIAAGISNITALPQAEATSIKNSPSWAEYLIRVDLPHPTIESLSRLFKVPVKGFSHVDENLYKVILPAGFERDESVLESGFVSHLQRNFIYRPALVRPQMPSEPVAGGFASEETDEGDPEVLDPLPNPSTGADPGLSKQWGIERTRSQEAWQLTRGSEDVVVAVIDSGVDYNHEDLRENMWRNSGEIPGNGRDDDGNGFIDDVVGWDFADNDPYPYDTMSDVSAGGNPGHGTHCAGVVAAVGKNNRGISGVAPNVKVMALRFITENGEGTTESAIKAIKYAVKNGATILSNSWGGEEPDESDAELKRVIKWAQDRGALLVFAAGNGREGIGYNNDTDANPTVPASFDLDGILSVAAIDRQDRLGQFSNFGVKTVDIAAPGVRIYSTVPKDRYEDRVSVSGVPLGDWSGTSMATPHVAGAAALIKSLRPELKGIEIKDILLKSARPLSQLKSRVGSGGTLDVLAALEATQGG